MTIFLIQINYKSGIQQKFWCEKFEIQNKEWSWTWVNSETTKRYKLDSTRPVKMGVEEIESVWVLEEKEVKIK